MWADQHGLMRCIMWRRYPSSHPIKAISHCPLAQPTTMITSLPHLAFTLFSCLFWQTQPSSGANWGFLARKLKVTRAFFLALREPSNVVFFCIGFPSLALLSRLGSDIFRPAANGFVSRVHAIVDIVPVQLIFWNT